MITLAEIEKAYSDYSKEIFYYIIKSVRDHDLAEDILQDVYIKLINYSSGSEVHSGNIRALLYSIARSVCIDTARKRTRTKTEIADIDQLQYSHSDDKDDDMIDIMESLIDRLGEPEKSIILFRKNGLTYSEISAIMKISERTLKRKVKSVIENFRKNLKESGFLISDDTI